MFSRKEKKRGASYIDAGLLTSWIIKMIQEQRRGEL